LTAEWFVTNPFTGRADDRLYRTGDLGRYRLNGDVDFLGRVDRQIKLRGFRIEPHEIEYVLCRHQAVRNAVVVLQPAPGTAGGLLVAYLVCESNVSTLALRRHLREFLPEHMIPARLVIVEALPLTPHGKIDYEALCSMPEAPEDAGAYVPPEGPTEREVARVWREMLGIDRVGRYDHFFDLGGHSLLTIKAADLLSERLGMTVPIREFFNQTLAQLAASCDRRLAGKERDDASARV
jgi:hypothetical protein